jgi:hypothetical protein
VGDEVNGCGEGEEGGEESKAEGTMVNSTVPQKPNVGKDP